MTRVEVSPRDSACSLQSVGYWSVKSGWYLVLVGLVAAAGCRPAAPAHFMPSEQATALSPELQKEIDEILRKHCGTPAAPLLLGSDRNQDEAFRRHLQHGAEVYAQRCQACHGVTGDGNGPAAAYLQPRPRDYRRGIFKFTSTPYGAKPRRADLERTIRRGITGTSMPAFALLSDEDVQAVVDYVLVLAMRGELELLLASTAESEDELDPDVVSELVASVPEPWNAAASSIVLADVPMPAFSDETVAAGKEAFLTKGCSKCHGEDGRGLTQENVGTDAWGFSTRAADLTSGMLRGGRRPLDIYRRISSGINGTPMPSFHDALAENPETIWQLAHYVLSVSNRRREGVLPSEVPAAASVAPAESTVPSEEGTAPSETEPNAAGAPAGDSESTPAPSQTAEPRE